MYTIAFFVDKAFTVYSWLLLIRVLLSWLPNFGPNALTNFIYEITEPVLAPFRKLIPVSPSLPIDFSPIFALLAVDLLRKLLLTIIL